jgi:hypothetical protein
MRAGLFDEGREHFDGAVEGEVGFPESPVLFLADFLQDGVGHIRVWLHVLPDFRLDFWNGGCQREAEDVGD